MNIINNKKTILKVLTVQILIFSSLLLIDLYVFRGYYSSKVIINPSESSMGEDISFDLKIEKANRNYIFKLTNNSLNTKYFMNYRNEELFQNVADTLPLYYLQRSFNNSHPEHYHSSFDCGTGLGLTSINPFDSFEITKTYEEIISENNNPYLLIEIEFIKSKLNKEVDELEYKEIDSILKKESLLLTEKDSIKIEYYLPTLSYISKKRMYTISNKINLSMKDLLMKYTKEN